MQEYVFSINQPGFSNRLDLFEPPAQDCGIISSQYVRIGPTTAITSDSPITFKVDRNHGGYIAGDKTFYDCAIKDNKGEWRGSSCR